MTLQPEDKKLLKEVGKNGEGSPTEIQQLIDEVCLIPCIKVYTCISWKYWKKIVTLEMLCFVVGC